MLDKNLQSFQWSFEIKSKTDEKNSSVIFIPPGAFFWDIPQIQSNSTIFSQLNPPLVQFNPENIPLVFAPSFRRKKRQIFSAQIRWQQGRKVNKQNFRKENTGSSPEWWHFSDEQQLTFPLSFCVYFFFSTNWMPLFVWSLQFILYMLEKTSFFFHFHSEFQKWITSSITYLSRLRLSTFNKLKPNRLHISHRCFTLHCHFQILVPCILWLWNNIAFIIIHKIAFCNLTAVATENHTNQKRCSFYNV